MSNVGVDLGGHTVLDRLNLRIERGERVAVVGPSGAGKTSFLRLLNGTLRPSRGHVEHDGVELGHLTPRELRAARSKVGFVHQDHALIPNLRVSQNVTAGRLGSHGFLKGLRAMVMPARDELREVHALLEGVGIPEKIFARTDTLSGGQQQRVAIARALYQQPTALVADEPLASVDPARARDLIRLILEVVEEHDLTLVVALHDLDIAREFFPRLIGLRAGKLELDGTPEEVCGQPLADLYDLDTDTSRNGGANGGR